VRALRWLILALALLVALGGVVGCEEEEDEEPTADEWIERGKEMLAEGDGAGAYLAFSEALEQEEDNAQAKYGVILADVLQFADTVELLVGLLSTESELDYPPEAVNDVCRKVDDCGLLEQLGMSFADCLTGGGGLPVDEETIACVLDAPSCDVLTDRCFALLLPPSQEQCNEACVRFGSCGFFVDTDWQAPECAAACTELYLGLELQCFTAFDSCDEGRESCFAFVGDVVTGLLEEFWPPIGEEMGAFVADVAAEPEFEFEQELYTVTLIDPFLRPAFSGTHDVGDLYFFAAVYSGIDTLFSGALALDMDLNPLLLAQLGLADVGGSLGLFSLKSESDSTVADIIAALDQVLGDPVYNEFLRLREDAGEGYMQQAGVQLGMTFGYLARMIEAVAHETDDQTDDAIRYVDADANGHWGPGEMLIVPGVAELDYELAWALHEILLALKVDFVDGYPFELETLAPLLEYLGLGELAIILDILESFGTDAVELGGVFRYPDPDGARPLVKQVRDLLASMNDAF
jgi:hypothetical protein